MDPKTFVECGDNESPLVVFLHVACSFMIDTRKEEFNRQEGRREMCISHFVSATDPPMLSVGMNAVVGGCW